jgi:Zn-dependent peptidase ImmA (M78 family)
MGRKPGPVKNTKVFRITPDDDKKLEEILRYWQASRSFHNLKVYTRSDVVGQALRQYWLQQKAKHETDGKYCGICGNPTRREQ